MPRGKILQETILDFIKTWLRIDATEVAGVESTGPTSGDDTDI